jgi:hypothetical protein
MFAEMCGRLTQAYNWAEVYAFLSVIAPARTLRPRYNTAPTTIINFVRPRVDGCELVPMRWGGQLLRPRERHRQSALLNSSRTLSISGMISSLWDISSAARGSRPVPVSREVKSVPACLEISMLCY